MKVTKDNLFTIRINKELEKPLNAIKHIKRLNSYSDLLDLLIGNYLNDNPISKTAILHFKATLSKINEIKKKYKLSTSYSYLEKLFICDLYVTTDLKEEVIKFLNDLGVNNIEEKI